MKNDNHAKADNHEYLTIDEVAAKFRVTPRSVRRWISEGQLPAERIAGRWIRIKAEDADRMATPVQHL